MNDVVVDYLIGVLNGVKPDRWRLARVDRWPPGRTIVLCNASDDIDDWVSVEEYYGNWRVKVKIAGVDAWRVREFNFVDHGSVVSAFRSACFPWCVEEV
jgi:hypothetical protein